MTRSSIEADRFTPNYNDSKYGKISSASIVTSTGVTVADGEVVGFYRIRLNGAGFGHYVAIVFDLGGPDEKVIASSHGDIDLRLDPSLPMNQVIGNGVSLIQVVLTNDNDSTSPYVGGAFEATIIG